MPGGIEHHAKLGLVSIDRLVRCRSSPDALGVRDGSVEIFNLHFEVSHLGLLTRLLWPNRRRVPRLRLDVQSHIAYRIGQLDPVAVPLVTSHRSSDA